MPMESLNAFAEEMKNINVATGNLSFE